MSPEQAAGKTVDHRTDIFSMGIILYQMLTGQRPFSGDTTTTLLSSIIKDTPASVTEVNPAVPRDLGRIIKRCLTKDPERRYQIAKDLRNELEEAKQEVVSGDAIVGAAPSRIKPTSWSKALWAAGAVIALFAVAWIATRGPSAEGTLRLANPVQVTTAIGVEDYLSWSPDGRTLAYHQYEHLTAGLVIRSAAFSRDETKLAYSKGRTGSQCVAGPHPGRPSSDLGRRRIDHFGPKRTSTPWMCRRMGNGCSSTPIVAGTRTCG